MKREMKARANWGILLLVALLLCAAIVGTGEKGGSRAVAPVAAPEVRVPQSIAEFGTEQVRDAVFGSTANEAEQCPSAQCVGGKALLSER